MDIYSRIKFNLTFERDLDLLELKNEFENALTIIKTTDNFLKKLADLEKEFKGKYKEVKKQTTLINDCSFLFDFSKIFVEIGVEEFIECIKEKFQSETIDLYGKEINNIYRYIYYIKNGIYNKEAYQTTFDVKDY